MNTPQSPMRQLPFSSQRPTSGWRGELELSCKNGQWGTRLVATRHYGPLYIQKPFYPEGETCMHLYPLHPPGGVVSGDELHIQLNATAAAQVLLTTPGALRFYKSRDTVLLLNPGQVVTNDISVSEHSCVEWLPMESIVFNGAHARNDTRVFLDASSQFIGWDIVCLGLPASEAFFTSGALLQSFEIYRLQRPLFIDRMRCVANKTVLKARAGLAGHCVYGTLVFAPSSEFDSSPQAVEAVLGELRQHVVAQGFEQHIAITGFNTVIIARYLGHSTEHARLGFEGLWRIMRPKLTGRVACTPRIWRA